MFLRARHRDFVFWRAMRRFIGNPEVALAAGSNVIPDFIYGWGNEGWSAPEEYLKNCLRNALTCGGPILECGTGLSTILVGVIAQKHNNAMWSLEHRQEWGERVDTYLKKYRIDSVRIFVGPLKHYANYSWYDPPLDLMPDSFALIICDGPPGDTRGGRYGLAPQLREKLKPGCVILLDDAKREQEIEIAARWSVELCASCEIIWSSNPYIKMTLMDPRAEVSGVAVGKTESCARNLKIPLLNELRAKSRLLGGGDDGPVVIAYVPYDDRPQAAEQALHDFVGAMLPTITQSLAAARQEKAQ
jgi:hypothetical protein